MKPTVAAARTVPLLLLTIGLATPSPSQAPESASSASVANVVRMPLMPHAVTSFGAARSGDFVYAYGGHTGRAHQHSRDNLVGDLHRLDLTVDSAEWEKLPANVPLQGTALAAAPDGRLFRVGGLDAHNRRGEPGDLHSVASVDVFDPEQGTWESFAPLPEPRSSHDAIFVGDHLYVMGGWHLAGEEAPIWHETAWVCDPSAESPEWRKIDTPSSSFPRRACAVARFGHKVAVVGGMDEFGTIADVTVFDPATDSWQEVASLPGQGFGAAAVGVGEHLYATVMNGRLLRYEEGASEWTTVTTLTMPRFFHRLVPRDEGSLLVLGGAHMIGHMRSVEVVPTAPGARHSVHEWSIASPGSATHRAALTLTRKGFLAFGGNRGADGERFASEQFVDEVVAVDFADMTARMVGSMPAGRQSMAIASWQTGEGGRRSQSVVCAGGIGPVGDGGDVRSSVRAAIFDARSGEVASETDLTSPRTAAVALEHEDHIWLLGGIDFRPDAGGRGSADYPLDVLVCDVNEPEGGFVSAGVELESPLRSFGAAVLGNEAYLIGGLVEGFQATDSVRVLDLEAKTWRNLPAPPRAWVSPQVATIGDAIYVACGGTMSGRRFTEDRSVFRFRPESGWEQVVAELPFAVRHVQMLAMRDRLVFVDMNEAGSIVVRTLHPSTAELVPGQTLGH